MVEAFTVIIVHSSTIPLVPPQYHFFTMIDLPQSQKQSYDTAKNNHILGPQKIMHDRPVNDF